MKPPIVFTLNSIIVELFKYCLTCHGYGFAFSVPVSVSVMSKLVCFHVPNSQVALSKYTVACDEAIFMSLTE